MRGAAALAIALLGLAGAGRAQPAPPATETAFFAGGCFWCTEADFDRVPGVVSTTSGYLGGPEPAPTYEQVSSGETGHAEAVKVEYDPARVRYEQLVEYFWRTIDPLAKDAQFCDRGRQYRTALFPLDDAQRRVAEASKARLEASKRFDRPIATEIAPAAASEFTPAEDYHQDYHQKNPIRYRYYRTGCRRDATLTRLWGEEAGGKTLLPEP